MSSYFDSIGLIINNPQAFVEFVRDQYRQHLIDVVEVVLVKDLDRFTSLLREYDRKFSNLDSDSYSPELMLQNIHSFAHSIGEARIGLRGGRILSDNPHLRF